ncbi:MAG: sigma-54 dependent transcriptional regulator [Gammaproteobacteria bacterium]|nr:sigma-54 dependent transcriptional regulator [Gammaproteobacteria bacterium]
MENNSIKKALIIDDEPDICQLAEITLNRMGLETRSANDINTGKKLLQSESFDLCLTDMNLPDGDGIDLVSYISDNFPNMPVAVITAYGNMESAVRALKAGAFDFVSKPVDLQILRNLISSAIKLPRETAELFNPETTKSQILGNSAVIQNLRQKISKLARSQAPVFIHGESGCGKELAARLIHEQGARAENPFIAINCGAIPSELMESEFFGHKKGSFTGAASDKEGLFMAANQGTLFLDEVADLPLHMQVKLLRAIQEKAIRPVGEHEEKPVDVRILSASHKNLAELVKQGKFREDLFYRINVIELEVASLKDRTEDIPVLADFFLQQLSQQSGLVSIPSFTPEAEKALIEYHFPGNVRELENILERALALLEGNIIDVDDLQLPKTTSNIKDDTSSQNAQLTSTQASDHDKAIILKALEDSKGNKTAAARSLGLTRRQFRYRLEKLGLE